MAQNRKFIILSIGLATILGSCQNTNIKNFDDVDDQEVEAINNKPDSLTAGLKFNSKGATWKAWNKYFKACLQSPTLQKAQFAGYSNSVRVGDIRTIDGLRSYSLATILSPTEYNNWVTVASQSNGCKVNREIEQEISNTIAASFLGVGNADLKTAMHLIDSTNIEIGSFALEEIANIDAFKDFINAEPKLIQYKETISKRNRRLIVQAVKVSSAKIFIKLNTEISAELTAKLDSVLTETIKVSDGQLELKFSKTNNRTISCDINHEFYIFIRTKKVR